MRNEQPSPEPEAETDTAPTSIIDAYLNAWRRMFDYTGVSTRREYWVFILAHWLVLFPTIGFLSGAWIFETNTATWLFAGFLNFGHMGIALVVSIPLTIRRVRDATSSGWFTFLWLAGPLLLLGIAACPRYDARRLASLPDRYWDIWRKSADYLGVSKRQEFWPFTLINTVIVFAIITLAVLLLYTVPNATNNSTQAGFGIIVTGFWIILALLFLAAIPWFPLAVRRVRDATGSGWVAIVGLVFFPLSLIVIAIIALLPSRESDTIGFDRMEARTRQEPEQREAEDPWARPPQSNRGG